VFATLAQAVDRWLAGDHDALPAVERAVRELTVEATIALAARLRDRSSGATFGWRWAYLRGTSAPTLSAHQGRVEIAGLPSLHRDGYMRGGAVRELVQTRAPLALRFLALRLDDIVDGTREGGARCPRGPARTRVRRRAGPAAAAPRRDRAAHASRRELGAAGGGRLPRRAADRARRSRERRPHRGARRANLCLMRKR
jgi:hypothetical protein